MIAALVCLSFLPLPSHRSFLFNGMLSPLFYRICLTSTATSVSDSIGVGGGEPDVSLLLLLYSLSSLEDELVAIAQNV